MNENDFDKDIKAALDDIVDTAPKPPKWKWITAGYAPLQQAESKPWYRGNGAAFLGAAAATILVVGVAALIGSGLGSTDPSTLSTAPAGQTVESLRGIWVLDNYTTDGETHPGESSTEGRTAPWIEFTAESVKGFAGCNDFWSGQPPQITDGRLILGEVLKNAAGCLEPTPESVIADVIWSGSDGVAIEITATTMQLTTETSTLIFERRDRRPVSKRTEWGVWTDDLACADGVALNHRLIDPNATITEMLTAVPSVASIEEKDEFDYSIGYNAEGAAVATVIAGDIEPRQYHRRSCASLWGIRSEANLGGAVLTWVNDLGLGQRSTDVWSDRFVEMCATNNGELGPLAERYVSEDADFSLWAGGALPTAEQVTQTLETIWLMTCAASSFEEPLETTSTRVAETSLSTPGEPSVTTLAPTVGGPVEGQWNLVAFTVDGSREDVVVHGNAGTDAWIMIGPEIEGNAGCNGFSSWSDPQYTYTDGSLVLNDIIKNEARCEPSSGGDDWMTVELLLADALWTDGAGVAVTFLDDDTMIWTVEPGRTFELSRES